MLSYSDPSKKPKINDLIHFNKLRGYDRVGPREPIFNSSKHPFSLTDSLKYIGNNHGAYFALTNTTKYKVLDYPFLNAGGGNFGLFLHHSHYCMSNRLAPGSMLFNKKNWRHSAGIGIGMSAGAADIEVLYNFAHSSHGNGDKPGWF